MTEENGDKVKLKVESIEDGISGLPDDILVNIISRLTLAEAGATSVLSTRWKYLCTFITVLNFDALQWIRNLNRSVSENDTTRYINWVNKVLQLHRGLSINEFKVGFSLDATHESDITYWIYTAVLKRVQKLELDLLQCHPKMYTIPQECYDRLKTPCFLSSIKSLMSLCLHSVNVTGEILEFFIHNCPYLEKLDVSSTVSLLRLKVVGPLLRLKYLHIHNCNYFEELEISCPSLLSFSYRGPIIKFCIKNVPRLAEVSIRGEFVFQGYGIGVGRVIGPIESYFPQLKTLRLDVDLDEEGNQFPKFELPALRHLRFFVSARDYCSNLLDLTSLVESCPFLQNLTLELNIVHSTEVRSRHQYPKRPHQHLKVVELIELYWEPVELELIFYLLENTTMLEELHLRISDEVGVGGEYSREQAKKLEEVVPPGIKLVIN